MKFRIEETVWECNGKPRFVAYVERENTVDGFVAGEDTIEQAHEKCRLYKIAQETRPKITYLEI